MDFGSDSARAVLVDSGNGDILAESSMNYPLWSEGRWCDVSASMYRQSPSDYMAVLRHIVPEVVAAAPQGARIAAIGVDATASTPCLLDARMEIIDPEDPDALFVLWKDHTALAEGREISQKGARYLSHCGGTYSAENLWSKVLHILRTNPSVASRAAYVIELCDYIPWLLTGVWRPSRCAAALKHLWDMDGFPPEAFFASLHPAMPALAAGIPARNHCSVEVCGHLSDRWAAAFGLDGDVVVAVGQVDAHSGAVGAGCNEDTMVLNLGTSACVMASGEHRNPIPGLFGQAMDSIIPSLEGFEMGMSSFGDNFTWFSRLTGRSIPELSDAAARVADDAMPLCTDWFNGRRSPSPDPGASASLLGLRLSTGPGEIFRSLVEADCFGIKAIVDHLDAYGVRPSRFVAVGGIAHKSPLLMQMLSDVLGREICVLQARECCALGAAMNASVAAGIHPDLSAAQKAMAQPVLTTWRPCGPSRQERYRRYLELQRQ